MELANLNKKQLDIKDLAPNCFDPQLKIAAAYFRGHGPDRLILGKTVGLLLVLLLAAGLWGCSSKPKVVQPQLPITADPGAPQWSFASNAISLKLRADQRLNIYDDQAHTLAVCLYQFTDPNTFNDLCKDESGLVKLLKCEKSGADVAAAQRVIMQPGESRDLHLDRAEGAKFFGVVAGYYHLKPESTALLFEIPIVVFKKGFIFTTKYQVPGQLNLQLNLGPTTMSEVEKK